MGGIMRAKTLELSRANNPKRELQRLLGDLSSFEIMHNLILVATYIEPEKTAGGIYKPQKSLDESKWQGKVGLVLLKGPGAFLDDQIAKFHGRNVAPGDWVVYRASDGWDQLIRGVHC